jgi:hypothetical protein
MPISLWNRQCLTCQSMSVPKDLQAQANRTGRAVPLGRCPACNGPAFVHPDPKSAMADLILPVTWGVLVGLAAGTVCYIALAG